MSYISSNMPMILAGPNAGMRMRSNKGNSATESSIPQASRGMLLTRNAPCLLAVICREAAPTSVTATRTNVTVGMHEQSVSGESPDFLERVVVHGLVKPALVEYFQRKCMAVHDIDGVT